jgi:hypothetical protein
MSRGVDVDMASWPLVVIRFPERLDLPAVESFVAGADLILGRKERFATVIDTTALKSFPNAIERRLLTNEMSKRTFAERAYNLGNAVILVSTPARAVLTAVLWVRPPPVAQELFATFEKAAAWARDRLVSAGVPIPADFEALQARAASKRIAEGK